MCGILPESPRWLMQRQKIEDAHKIINRIARMNGRPPIEIEVIQEIVESEMGGNSSEKLAKASYGLIFKNKKLRLTALCLMMIWFSWALVTFGLAYNIKNVPGDRYLNVVYLGIADSIGYPATLLIINRFGRRLSVVVSMSFGATFLVSLAVTYFIVDVTSYTTLVVMLYLLGKFGLAVTRTALRCLTAESFPTAVRSMGGGLCGIAISVGAIICPQLAYFGSKNPSIPLLVFAFISVLGSLFAFCMTETEGKPLQDSVARKLSRKISIISQNGQKEPANPTIGCQ